MRIDKYLKLARIIKRRTVATEICKSNRVKANDKIVKPSYQVMIGDILEITLGRTVLRIQVKDVRTHVIKDESTMLYEIIEEKRLDS